MIFWIKIKDFFKRVVVWTKESFKALEKKFYSKGGFWTMFSGVIYLLVAVICIASLSTGENPILDVHDPDGWAIITITVVLAIGLVAMWCGFVVEKAIKSKKTGTSFWHGKERGEDF